MKLEALNISKKFNNILAVDNINLTTSSGTARDVISRTNDFKGLKLYPNPVKGSSLNVLTSYRNVSYEIYNTIGQLVAKGTIKNNRIDVNSLNAAVYHIKFITEGETFIKRFIKE